MSRAYTPAEVRAKLHQKIRSYVRYWSIVDLDERALSPLDEIEARLSGLAFSILNILDGATDDLPAFDLTPQPHPSDKAYHKREGENWYEPVVINDDVYLHDEWYVEEKK